MSGLIDDKHFSLEIPAQFESRPDEMGYQCVCIEPPAVLTILSQAVENKDDLPNLSRMLSAFLTRSGHPVATDELLRITSVPSAIGFAWQYGEGGNYFRLWIFGNEASWLLMTLVCPEEHRVSFHELGQNMVKTLQLK